MNQRPCVAPLERLTDETGLVEHGHFSVPRRSHGYCVDDNGRALAVVSNVGGGGALRLARCYLAFLRHSHIGDGLFHLRLGYDRRWTDDAQSDDANARAVLGIGTAAAWGPGPDLQAEARRFFEEVQHLRSPFWRATATAALGAAAVLCVDPENSGACHMARDALEQLPRPRDSSAWPWPEDRLAYENALLPHALIRLGDLLCDDTAVRDGALLLSWLVAKESFGDHFSFTPSAGLGPLDAMPAFDQQPIEAWAMAEAALAAMRVVPCDTFSWAVQRAASWFHGDNDLGVAMIDPETGGGYDGLESNGVNANQGAESQLAVLGSQLAVYRYNRDLRWARPR